VREKIHPAINNSKKREANQAIRKPDNAGQVKGTKKLPKVKGK
jgi:hypothetical protein